MAVTVLLSQLLTVVHMLLKPVCIWFKLIFAPSNKHFFLCRGFENKSIRDFLKCLFHFFDIIEAFWSKGMFNRKFQFPINGEFETFWLEINLFRFIQQNMQNNPFDHDETQILVVGGLREREIQHSYQVCGVIDDVYM